MNSPRTVFLIAGEPSGDTLGASLISGMKNLGLPLTFQGIGGTQMMQAGQFDSRIPLKDLSVMGTEIISALPRLYRHLRNTIHHLRTNPPDLLLTIDAPEFTLRVAKALKQSPFPKIHCVAPSVWAWRPGRAQKIASFIDHLLTLFPFEPPFFEKEGLESTFIGHPFVEKKGGNSASLMDLYPNLTLENPILVLAPGSRRGEIQRLLPIFLKAAYVLLSAFPNLQVVIPTLPYLVTLIQSLLDQGPEVPCTLVSNQVHHPHVWAAGTCAVAASGTITLEMALAHLPHAVAYQTTPLLAFALKRLLVTPWVSLPNIILGHATVPEYLQERCTPYHLAEALHALLLKSKTWTTQKKSLQEIQKLLTPPHAFEIQAAKALEPYLVR